MIKAISQKDIPECVQVIRDSFSTVARDLGFTQENAPRFTAFAVTAQKLNQQFSQEHRPMVGYYRDGRLVGYYSLSIMGQECELNNLCVLPEYRHHKLGEKLLEHAFSNARKAGCARMNIGIVEENKVLRAWYESYGFFHTGTKKFDFFPFTCGYLVKEL